MFPWALSTLAALLVMLLTVLAVALAGALAGALAAGLAGALATAFAAGLAGCITLFSPRPSSATGSRGPLLDVVGEDVQIYFWSRSLQLIYCI
jgi:hypothetical protein